MTTWLVAEDEPDLYDILLSLWELGPIDGLTFTDGASVVSWIESVNNGQFVDHLPQLALLDIRLSYISGIEIATYLRQSQSLQDMTIVLITAYPLTRKAELAVLEQSGADLLIYKPFPAGAELQKILDHLSI